MANKEQAEFKANWFNKASRYVNEFPEIQWYVSKFGFYPNSLELDKPIEVEVLKLLDELGFEIIHQNYKLHEIFNFPEVKEAILLKGQVMLNVSITGKRELGSINLYFKELDDIQPILNRLNEHLGSKKEGKVYLTKNYGQHFDTKEIEIKNHLSENALSFHYGQSFNPVHQKVCDLLTDDQSRFLLFFGKPGTGKTNYLRYLVNTIPKRFIYIPSSFLKNLSGPELTDFLMDHKKSIFIIEDAEAVLMSRKSNPESPVNVFLNATDGFLADVFMFKFIVTVNGDVRQLDEALLRKGRLSMAHEFSELSDADSNALAKHLDLKTTFKGPHTLADIYNNQENGFEKGQKVGF